MTETILPRIFTIEIGGTPTLTFEAQNLREAQELCREQWLKDDLAEAKSNHVPLWDGQLRGDPDEKIEPTKRGKAYGCQIIHKHPRTSRGGRHMNTPYKLWCLRVLPRMVQHPVILKPGQAHRLPSSAHKRSA